MRIPVFVQVSSGAFGHQILDYEQVLFNCQVLKTKVRPIFFQSSKSANRYFLKQMKRNHSLLPHFPTIYFHKVLRRLSPTYRTFSLLLEKTDTANLKEIHDQSICLLASQIQSDKLESKYISTRFSTDRGLVGFVVRDDGYDSENGINLVTDTNRHRNSSFESFLPSVDAILESGRTIIRFGRHNHNVQKLGEYFYDLSDPSLNGLPESADFILASKCDFFISTGSGPDCLGMFFRKPTYLVNTIFPVLPQTRIVKKFLIKHYYYTDDFGRKYRLEFEELDEMFERPETININLRTGKLFAESRSPAEINDFIIHEVLGKRSSRKTSTYSEVAPSVFY